MEDPFEDMVEVSLSILSRKDNRDKARQLLAWVFILEFVLYGLYPAEIEYIFFFPTGLG
jgi:hypothetical protein